jgi:hypothetical protein
VLVGLLLLIVGTIRFGVQYAAASHSTSDEREDDVHPPY